MSCECVLTHPSAHHYRLHDTVESGTGETIFEFLAKNVGARRALGDFILITNGDIVLKRLRIGTGIFLCYL